MSETKWNVTLLIYRQKGAQSPHYDTFKLEVDPDEYVLSGARHSIGGAAGEVKSGNQIRLSLVVVDSTATTPRVERAGCASTAWKN